MRDIYYVYMGLFEIKVFHRLFPFVSPVYMGLSEKRAFRELFVLLASASKWFSSGSPVANICRVVRNRMPQILEYVE